MNLPINRKTLAITIAVFITVFFLAGGSDWLTLANLKAQQTAISTYHAAHPLLTILLYLLLYIAVAGLSLPGATLLTLAGGALFGLFWGTVIVSIASTIGAVLAFWAARFLCRDWVSGHFGKVLQAINEGIEREGAFYLFTLRLVPLFPFFMVNLLMGLTPMATKTFFWISQIGMLPGTLVYVNAGTELAKIDSLSGILSPGLIISFVIIGLLPWAAKKLLVVYGSKSLS